MTKIITLFTFIGALAIISTQADAHRYGRHGRYGACHYPHHFHACKMDREVVARHGVGWCHHQYCSF